MSLQLDDFFDFDDADGIRFAGHRIWIEHVLYQYIYNSRSPELIQRDDFPALSLEQIYAAILYYLHNKEMMTGYLKEWLERSRQVRREAHAKDPEFYTKWGRLKAERSALKEHKVEA